MPDDLAPPAGDSGGVPHGLDWEAFSNRYFPGRRRHDLEALTAYDAYKQRVVYAQPPAQEEDDRSRDSQDGAAASTAMQAWEDEGGAYR
jgi:hypothetical protein